MFGDGCIVHPKCTIVAEAGDIIFGDFCIIEEKCKIVNLIKKDEQGKPIKREMRIGNYNVFEACAYVENTDIGDMNEFQFRSNLINSKVESFCQVDAAVTVPKNTFLPKYSVVFDDTGKIRENLEFNEDHRKASVKEICAFLS